MTTETLTYTSTIVTTAELKTINIEPNLWVYSKTVSYGKPKSVGTFKAPIVRTPDVNEQGFVDDRNYELLKAGKSYKKLDLCVMPLDVQEKLRTIGYSNYFYNDPVDMSNVYDILSNMKKINKDTIVRVAHDCHMVFDRNGTPLPVAIQFDYISNGGITDGRFDLVKLAKHLLKRRDVLIYEPQGLRKTEVDTDLLAKTVEDAIAEVPYYNRERGCSHTIYFMWQPTRDAYRKMWDKCLQLNKKSPSTVKHQAIFDLDLLGFRRAGAAYFDNYYESRRYEVDYDD